MYLSFLSRFRPKDFLSNVDNTQTCPYNPTITCKPSNTFRTIDGSCNKPSTPYRGKSDTPYLRKWNNLYKGKYNNNITPLFDYFYYSISLWAAFSVFLYIFVYFGVIAVIILDTKGKGGFIPTSSVSVCCSAVGSFWSSHTLWPKGNVEVKE